MRGFIPHSEAEIKAMLQVVGVGSVDDLFATVPDNCKFKGQLDMAPGLDEYSTAGRLKDLAESNRPAGGELSFLGGGIYDRIIPAVGAHILSRPEFYSAYTPYQPEVSQGTLQVIFEFQTLIARLTGMDVANASLYDGASALAEALLLAASATRRRKLLLPASLQPATRRVVELYLGNMEVELETIPWGDDGEIDRAALAGMLDDTIAGVVVQSPNYFGVVENLAELAPLIKGSGALLCVHVDPGSLALLEAPGTYGADVVTGEGQSLGLPMSWGGPLLGIMATTRKHVRKIPGRLVGRTTDTEGRDGYVLTLQTREQHIRREKATSNICTNQALMALAATVYMSTLGATGMETLSRGLADRAGYLADRLGELPGYRLQFPGEIYQEMVIQAPVTAARILAEGLELGIQAGIPLGSDFPQLGDNSLLITVSEKHSTTDLDRLVTFLGGFKS
jgi:glycine dehydrogenase subunit 1